MWSGRKDARLLPGYRPLSWSENMPGQVIVSTPLYYPSLGSSPQPSMWQPQATPTSRPGGEGEEAMLPCFSFSKTWEEPETVSSYPCDHFVRSLFLWSLVWLVYFSVILRLQERMTRVCFSFFVFFGHQILTHHRPSI